MDNVINIVANYEDSCKEKHGDKLRIISESVYFDAMSITHILAEFIRRKYDDKTIFEEYMNYNSVSYAIEREENGERKTIFSTGNYFQYNFNEVHLLAFKYMLSELGAFLFDNENLWLIDRSQEGNVIKYEKDFDADNEYPEIKKFVEYLFSLQLQKNGDKLNFVEMKRALNDFLELEKGKPKQKIKEKNKQS